MKSFTHTVQNAIGLHARNAGLLVKEAEKFNASITVTGNGKTAYADKLMTIMALGAMHGHTLDVTIEGPDEEDCTKAIEAFFAENV